MENNIFRYRHIFLAGTSTTEKFTSPKGGGDESFKTPPRDRNVHGTALLNQLEDAVENTKVLSQERKSLGIFSEEGIYLQFKSEPGFDLKFESLEFSPYGIELLMVNEVEKTTYATVFVPEGKLKHFIKKIERYQTKETEKGKPQNKPLVESIADICKASLKSLWTDDREFFPHEGEKIWWEVWLRVGRDRKAIVNLFRENAGKIGLILRNEEDEQIEFLDRTVLLAWGNSEQMSKSVELLNCIAEIRKAKDNPEIFTQMTLLEQAEWVYEAIERIIPARSDDVAVCILDTGINREHPLIRDHLTQEDMHAYDPTWNVTDHCHHGTEMAGLALYGDLVDLLTGNKQMEVPHRLESVKIMPPVGENEPKLYGAITIESVARAEISAPHRKRIISLAVTTPDNRDRGQPSSWSASIDQLCSGAEDEDGQKRLVVISAGNTDPQNRHLYPDSNETDAIHDPAQAWNALCVGAFTEKVNIDQKSWPGWSPIAPCGGLSPSSCTSVEWQKSKWPIKPDIVLEGGNCAIVPENNSADYVDSLQLLSTHWKPMDKLLTITGDTSAATALAARMAAIIQSEYPEFWPETIRALIVHSADWTSEMKAKLASQKTKTPIEVLLRCCGFGVPNLTRALKSAANSLTLIIQDTLQPYDKTDSLCKTRDMHLHKIPWPTEILESLGGNEVEMKVTLSYFIEPNPARRGWGKKYSYASHGLKFDVKTPTETPDEFRKRINKAAREEEEKSTSNSDASQWLLGPQLRSKGSLHSDSWIGSASDLAQRCYIGIYPIAGWWKERTILGKWNKRARYSLIVSIATPKIDVDIYTPIINQITIASKI